MCGREYQNVSQTPSCFKSLFIQSVSPRLCDRPTDCGLSVARIHLSAAFRQHVPNQPKEGETRRESDVIPGGRVISTFHAPTPCSQEEAPDVIKLPAPGRDTHTATNVVSHVAQVNTHTCHSSASSLVILN